MHIANACALIGDVLWRSPAYAPASAIIACSITTSERTGFAELGRVDPHTFDRIELGDHAERLVAGWCGGTLASRNNPGWDVRSPEHGRVQVKARSRQTSKHLNWWHVSHVDRDGFDYLVCLLFDANGDVEGAWGLTVAEVRVHAHSTVTGTSGKRTMKLAIRGEWKQHADKIALSS